ncbi:MAG: M15 family metallopeptidase [Bacillota bacterium]|nr:M15 family metallopeptidase [Bacillota bacterium]
MLNRSDLELTIKYISMFIIILFTVVLTLNLTGCDQASQDLPLEVAEEDDLNNEEANGSSSDSGDEEIGEDESEIDVPPEEDNPEDGSPLIDHESDNENLSGVKVVSDGDYLLALVTKETTLKSDYHPTDLSPIPAYMFPSRELYLREEALMYLTDLWNAAEADGVILKIISAYRSYSYQKSLFQSYANRYGETQANRFSARAGQSEHQLGTTVDFGGTDVDLKAAFARTEQGQWLAENAHRFGFVLSYPEGKEEITGYIFEPWHYRYIGVGAAAEWKAYGLTLNEYLDSKPQYYD